MESFILGLVSAFLVGLIVGGETSDSGNDSIRAGLIVACIVAILALIAILLLTL